MDTSNTQRSTVLGALGAAALLLVAAPGPAALLAALSEPTAVDAPTAPLVALLTLLAWCLSAYLLTVAALTAGSRVPGAAGRALAAVARHAAPAGLRRALGLALGATLVVGAVAGPAGAAPTAGPVASASAVSTGAQDLRLPSLDHPVTAPALPLDHPTASPVPSLDHPAAAAPALPAAPAAADTPARPSPDEPVAPPAPVAADPGLPSTGAEQVLVQPGDSLWAIAQARLGPRATDAEVAQAWPTWWQANREQVGDDPDLLQPGTRLAAPPDRA